MIEVTHTENAANGVDVRLGSSDKCIILFVKPQFSWVLQYETYDLCHIKRIKPHEIDTNVVHTTYLEHIKLPRGFTSKMAGWNNSEQNGPLSGVFWKGTTC